MDIREKAVRPGIYSFRKKYEFINLKYNCIWHLSYNSILYLL